VAPLLPEANGAPAVVKVAVAALPEAVVARAGTGAVKVEAELVGSDGKVLERRDLFPTTFAEDAALEACMRRGPPLSNRCLRILERNREKQLGASSGR